MIGEVLSQRFCFKCKTVRQADFEGRTGDQSIPETIIVRIRGITSRLNKGYSLPADFHTNRHTLAKP
jgi:hypothetical protein